MAEYVNLPEGFELDEEQAVLPEGFVLDSGIDLKSISPETMAQIQATNQEYAQREPTALDKILGTLGSFGDITQLMVEKGASGATLGGYDWLNRKLKGDLKQREEALKEVNPTLGTGSLIASELAGNLAGGIGAKAVKYGGKLLGAGSSLAGKSKYLAGLAKTLQDAQKGGKLLAGVAGGLEGAGYGLTSSDKLEDVAGNVASGGALGALGGVGSEAISSGLGKLYNKAKQSITTPSELKSFFKKARQGATDLDILKSLKSANINGNTLMENLDDNLANVALSAKSTPKAMDILSRERSRIQNTSQKRNQDLIKRVFGDVNSEQYLKGIEEKANLKASPIYNRLRDVGNLRQFQATKEMLEGTNTGLNKELDEIVKDDYIRKLTKQLKSDPKYKLGDKSSYDFDVLDSVKKQLDSLVNADIKSGDNYSKSINTQNKQKIVDVLDRILPAYPEARKIQSDKFKILDSYEMGKKITLPSTEVEPFKSAYKDLGEAERESLKLGLRDKLKEVLGRSENVTNSAINRNMQDKIKTVLGKEEADTLIKSLKQERKRAGSFNRLFAGSNTAEKQNAAGLFEARDVNEALFKKLKDFLTKETREKDALNVAKTMTSKDTEDLIKRFRQMRDLERKKYTTPRLSAYLGGKITDSDEQ